MNAVRRSWSTRGVASLVAAIAALAFVPACGDTNPPTGSCTSSADCTGGRVCRDNTCVVPAGTDGGPDAPLPPGTDTGTTTPDAYFELPTDAGMIEMPDTAMGWSATDDSDGDTIGDFDEGRATLVDTDGDGTADYLDTDSDGDGVDDALEAGDAMISTPPVDTDADGTLDFRDLDADGNGVPDAVEGGADLDGDGRPNSRDRDNDGDGLLDTVEIGFDPSAPRDTDRDGTADYNTRDSDGDTISDTEEELVDTDGDGIADGADLDSDNDTILDAIEAGDASLDTPAVDTDGDTFPDFRDTDSDGDGLSDEAERGYGTSPTTPDTDGDGVSDLIEIGAGTSPTDGSVSPRTRGDFVFLVPFMQPPDPLRDTLQFSTNLQRADVYFMMDNTGSMGGTIANLQAGLTGTVIPAITTGIPEAWFGVGGFDDFPLGGFGNAGCGSDTAGITHDMAFFQYQTMTASATEAQTAVNRYRTNCGADGPESGVAALYALATRDTLGGYARFPGAAAPACAAGFRGAACFRPDAVPIIIVMTDVDQHNRPGCSCNYSTAVPLVAGSRGPSWAATITALRGLNARVVGVNTSGGRPFLEQLVNETTIASGAPGAAATYVLDAFGGSGLSATVVDLVRRAAAVPLDVSAQAVDLADAGETVDAVTAFVDHLEPNAAGAPGLTCTGGFGTSDYAGIDGDSFADTFLDVTPGVPVCFDIIPRMNDSVPATLVPQVFRAQINVIGDGFTPLDDRVVYFLVPPRIPDPNE
ncbi:MAG: hypothetical protein J0L92_31650 [Deltaproteobacteria bacterium]|nr:hypothetical protein [Deltaproteobacteria bacterium]